VLDETDLGHFLSAYLGSDDDVDVWAAQLGARRRHKEARR
jgi:hypothetical protein